MTTIIIKGHMLAYHFKHMPDGEVHWTFDVYGGRTLSDELLAAIPHEFAFDPPEINVVAQQVAGLEAAKAKALADYQKTVAEINDRLSKLLAITNETV